VAARSAFAQIKLRKSQDRYMSVCSAKKETAVHACVLHASLHEGGLRVCVRASVFVGTSSSSAKPTHSISLPPPLLSQTVDLVCKDLDKYHHALDKYCVPPPVPDCFTIMFNTKTKHHLPVWLVEPRSFSL